MPRPLRNDYEGAWHHVVNRGTAKAPIFHDDSSSKWFLDSVSMAGARYGIQIHAYCLMSNHYHLLIRSEQGKLADAMRYASGRFTRIMNASAGRDGPIFRGRYHSREICDDGHLVQTVRYIHLNPVEAGLTTTPEGWRWSSARCYLTGDQVPEWLNTNEILAMFGPVNERENYIMFLLEGVDDVTERRNAAWNVGGAWD